MASRVDVLGPARPSRSVPGRQAAAAFARLLGLAFVMSLALGLLLTAAAVALPAPSAPGHAAYAEPVQ